jgi:hypothetical protein
MGCTISMLFLEYCSFNELGNLNNVRDEYNQDRRYNVENIVDVKADWVRKLWLFESESDIYNGAIYGYENSFTLFDDNTFDSLMLSLDSFFGDYYPVGCGNCRKCGEKINIHILGRCVECAMVDWKKNV